MGEETRMNGRSPAKVIFWHLVGFSAAFLVAYWLRPVSLEPDPVLQGYLQVISALLAFVFAALAFVRFQGTQDRIALILGGGFLLSGAVLSASSVLFFQFEQVSPLRAALAPVAWWLSRIVLALLLLVALLVERFIPRSRHTKAEIAGALLAVVCFTYFIALALRRLPPEVSRHPGALDRKSVV
jgi:flagellar biogenesis protein FliO